MSKKPLDFKTYRPNDQTFMGIPRSGKPYLVQMNEGFHRYLYPDGTTSSWSHKIDKVFARFIKNGKWVEVESLPETPWILQKV